MTLPAPNRHYYTVDEYFRREHDAPQKHEYRDGEIVAMAEGSPNHSLITANIVRELGNALKGKPCRVYDSNLRVGIPRSRLYTYPDASVVCGELKLETADSQKGTITNPRLVVKVLSPSSQQYDRGDKFDRYRDLESLREYVLVSQDSARVEGFFRQADGTWSFSVASAMGSKIALRSLDVELAISEIYAGVDFPAAKISEESDL